MAAINYPTCINFVLKWEGGYVDHPRDPGGATNRGITIHTLRRWRGGAPVTKQDVKNLTLEETHRIYRRYYWDVVSGDSLPAGVDLAVFDYGVNSGPKRGLDAYAAARNRLAIPADIAKAICQSRLSFVRRLKTWSTFGKGWSRRIAECEALAVRMALAVTSRTSRDIARDLRKEGAAAGQKAKTKDAVSKGAGGGAVATGGGGAAVSSWDPSMIAFILVVVAVLGFVAFMAWSQKRDEDERQKAYLDQALKVEG